MDKTVFSAAVLTVSDRSARGERPDESGPAAAAMLAAAGYQVASQSIVPDERTGIEAALTALSESGIALIVTTGGMVPGIPEAMRLASLAVTPRAMLSRAVAGIRDRTLIVNLPGSPKAVRENLEAVLPALRHGLEVLRGASTDCG